MSTVERAIPRHKKGRVRWNAGVYGDPHQAVADTLSGAIDLKTFKEMAGELTPVQRALIVEQALLLMESNYVHLPLKRAMHAVDPVQRLRLLRFRLAQGEEMQELAFHKEMLRIFAAVRDLHTNYLLPRPFSDHAAFLPFLVEEYREKGKRKFLVSQVATGFDHATFRPGVEVVYWNGMPIERAVELNGEWQGGSNAAASFARGLESLTIRPMVRSLPPEEEWVDVGYRAGNGGLLELRLDWRVLRADEAFGGFGGNHGARAAAGALGYDIQAHRIGQVKKTLFAPRAIEAQHAAAATGAPQSATDDALPTTLPGVLKARTVITSSGTFGYIRIYTFSVDDADAFVAEFVRLAAQLPQNGLIVDVRGNGGGLIWAGERLLQTLTPGEIEPERVEFINTPVNAALCDQHADDDMALRPWLESMSKAVATGATYSSGFPITDRASCNAVGQRYCGPVVLVVDPLCYSTTDIFSAGFQDHAIGPVLGTGAATGAGGANVWEYGLLSDLDPRRYRPLPKGTGMRIAIRRTLRVGPRAGTPVEDLGVQPDEMHEMTRDDLLKGNADLIEHAAGLLKAQTVRELSGTAGTTASGTRLTVRSRNLDRVDVYAAGRPLLSRDVQDGESRVDVKVPGGTAELTLRGFDGGQLVASCRVPL
ncbi:MAG TPA: S41 family peptidase [Longimicrobium sp.]|nr:S41 family peptidase [Longimicrobium sp.]